MIEYYCLWGEIQNATFSFLNQNHQLADLRVTVLESDQWTGQERKRQELYLISQYLTDHRNSLIIQHVLCWTTFKLDDDECLVKNVNSIFKISLINY